MAPIKGLSQILRNLKKEIDTQRLATKAGLYESALVVKADSVKKTSIDLGNLRGSCFVMVTDLPVDKEKGSFEGPEAGIHSSDYEAAKSEGRSIVGKDKKRLIGIVAYSAYYAIYVHEMPANYNFNQGENKFLEKSLKKNQKRIISILKKHLRARK